MRRGLELKGSHLDWRDWAIDGFLVVAIIVAATAVGYWLL
jgi:hypothetical protein